MQSKFIAESVAGVLKWWALLDAFRKWKEGSKFAELAN
jgi:hypothetical protein